MKKYTINYSFRGNRGLNISGEYEVLAGDSQEAKNLTVAYLRNKYAANVTIKDVYWIKK